ncbi:Sulfotransferase domain protein [Pseudovibrio axinellae]|uniref:Sulfotransferase domain protein n=1 Tax=Pseudovibrio axinellae TaxID=989403 RepID=A0A165WMW0_9HYPH|nr:tetratricopeptide repeat-containing sulfotransferase family protein [Pseudovibrio axinellae]KZL16713.1 Sulfotransferase domain protein [Pseudovibrio axinellae]SEQ77730.1 Sulfotransferase family protein [Pseudovibrio axinellae]
MSQTTFSLGALERSYSSGKLSVSNKKMRKQIKKLIDTQNFAGALEKANAYLSVKEDDRLVQFFQAFSFFGVGEGKQAIKILEELTIQVPNNTEIWRTLAIIYNKYGSFAKEVDAREKVVKIDNRNGRSWFELAGAYKSVLWLEEEQQAYLQLVKLAPKLAAAWIGLGKSYRTCLKVKEAAAAYGIALELEPNSRGLKIEYATAMGEIGLFSESDAMLNKLIEEEFEAGVFFQLAQRNQVKIGDDLYNSAVKFLERKNSDNAQRSATLSGLATIHEKEKEYVKSSEFYHESAVEKKGDCKTLRILVDTDVRQTRRAFTEEFCSQLKGGAQSKAPIFIVGLPRCGSTLVEQIISSHSAVVGAGELSYLNRLTIPVNKEPFYKGFAHSDARQHSALGAQYLSLVRRLESYSDRFTDKALGNWIHIGLIRAILPNAKVVHVKRNVNASNFALFKQNFGRNVPYSNTVEDIWWWRDRYESSVAFWEERFPGFVHNVAYEDVVSDQEGETQKLLEYLELPWEDQVLDFHKNERSVLTASVSQVRKKIYSSSLETWRNYEGTAIDALFHRPDDIPPLFLQEQNAPS